MIHFFENDSRFQTDPTFMENMGSFSVIIHNLNRELKSRGLYSELDRAKWTGFATGLDLDFYPQAKKRFVVAVWESNIWPDFLVNMRRTLEGPNYKFLGLSRQYVNSAANYGFKTEVVDIGTDIEFWKRENPPEQYYPLREGNKFKIISPNACNTRSSIDKIIEAFVELSHKSPGKYQLTIKDTEERNKKLPEICKDLSARGYDITYICQRMNRTELKNLLLSHHLCLSLNNITSGGLINLDVAALKLPSITPFADPTYLYPASEHVNTKQVSLASVRPTWEEKWGLPHNFTPGWIDEGIAMINEVDKENLKYKMELISNNYTYYLGVAEQNRRTVERRWTWANSCDQLVDAINRHEEKYKNL